MAGESAELFSEDDDPASPETPVQSQRKESCSLPLVPRWCFEEGLMKKRQITSKGKGRRIIPTSDSEADSDEVKESLKEIQSVLKTLSERVGKNDDKLKELQEETARSVIEYSFFPPPT